MDIKPENIVLTNDHHIVFIDFGFAKNGGEKSYNAKGTPFYAAPELKYDEDGFDPYKSDVWSLGMTLYLLLERRRPFNLDKLQQRGETKITAKDVWNFLKQEDLKFYSRNEYYQHYHYLISKMLEKNPKKRWNIFEVKAENDQIV
jgi:serine/threonine protein kinase